MRVLRTRSSWAARAAAIGSCRSRAPAVAVERGKRKRVFCIGCTVHRVCGFDLLPLSASSQARIKVGLYAFSAKPTYQSLCRALVDAVRFLAVPRCVKSWYMWVSLSSEQARLQGAKTPTGVWGKYYTCHVFKIIRVLYLETWAGCQKCAVEGRKTNVVRCVGRDIAGGHAQSTNAGAHVTYLHSLAQLPVVLSWDVCARGGKEQL